MMKEQIENELEDIKAKVKPLHIFIFIVCIGFIFVNGGVYSGILCSALLSMIIGIVTVFGFSENKSLNVINQDKIKVKYVTILCSAVLAAFLGAVFNLISGMIFSDMKASYFQISIGIAWMIPLIWCGIILPVAYKFGYYPVAILSLVLIMTMVFLMRYFENGKGGIPTGGEIHIFLLAGIPIALIIYLVSYLTTSKIVQEQ